MLTHQDIVTYNIGPNYIDIIVSNAKKAEIGGCSRIRSKTDRMKNLSEDQLVGQISTYCASMILTKSSLGYIQAREKANANPNKGDNGVDIVGLPNIDIKGSLMRYSNDPLKYRLLVREKERHPNWIYVLGLVPNNKYTCHLVGWAKDSDLPDDTYNGPIKSLHGAYVIEANQLNKISELIKMIDDI